MEDSIAVLANRALAVCATLDSLPDTVAANVAFDRGVVEVGRIVAALQRRPAVTLADLSGKAALFAVQEDETALGLSIARDVARLLPVAAYVK